MIVPTQSTVLYTNESLTQSSTRTYLLSDKGRRITPSQCDVKKRTQVQFTMVLNLPMFLTPTTWKRHEFTLEDVVSTLDSFSAISLWQLALMYDIAPSSSAIKLSFSNPEAMVFGSKAIVIRKIVSTMLKIHSFSNGKSVLDTQRVSHTPKIPIHKIENTMYDEMIRILPSDRIDVTSETVFERVLKWRDITIVPLWIEDDAIYAIRVVGVDVFLYSGRSQNICLSTMPVLIRCHDGTYYAGIDEAIFMVRFD